MCYTKHLSVTELNVYGNNVVMCIKSECAVLLKFGVSGKLEWREYLPQSSRGWKFIIHSRRLGVQRLTQGVHGRLTDFIFLFF